MHDRITINPAVCHGKPVIRGTRVPVTVIVGSLAAGMTREEIQREYDVTPEDIRAFAAVSGDINPPTSTVTLPRIPCSMAS